MAKWVLMNSVKLALNGAARRLDAGKVIDDSLISVAAIQAAGGLVLLATDANIAAAATHTRAARLKGRSPAQLSSQMLAAGVDAAMSIPSGPAIPPGAVLMLDPSTVMASEGTIIATWGVATQAASTLQPFPDSKNAGGGAAVVFGGGPYQSYAVGNAAPTPSPTWMSIPSTALSIPFWMAFEFELNGGNPGAVTHQIPLELSADISTQVGVMLSSSQSSAGGIPSIQVRGPNGLMTIDINQAQATGFQWAEDDLNRLVEIICDGTKAGTIVKINGIVQGTAQGVTVGGVDPGTGAISTVGTIGSKHDGTASATMAVALLAWWNRVPVGGDSAALYAYVAANTNRLADRRNNFAQHYQFLSFGDSIEAWNIFGPPSGRNGANLGPRYYPFGQLDAAPQNFAVATALGGATLSASGSGFSSQIIANYDAHKGTFTPGMHYVVAGDGGINDIALIFAPSDSPSAITAANAIIALMQAFVAHVVSDLNAVFSPDGHDIKIRTITAGFDAVAFPFFEQCRLLVNAGYRTAFANNVAGSGQVRTWIDDLGADTFLGTQTGRQLQAGKTLYLGSDGLHPTFAGTRRSVGIEMAQMASVGLITSPTPAADVAPINLVTTVGVVDWWRGDQGITAVSGLVSQWDGKGGRGYQLFQTNPAKRLTFSASGGSNSKPCLIGTPNSGTILKCPAFYLQPPFSYFIVCDITSAVANNIAADFVGNSFACTFPQQITINNTGATDFPIPFGWHIFEVQCPAAGNGTLIIDNGAPFVGTGPGVTATGLAVGATVSDPGNNSWGGGIGEFLPLDGILSPTERTNVTRAMGTYWGITVP